jgi:hypothetical protein
VVKPPTTISVFMNVTIMSLQRVSASDVCLRLQATRLTALVLGKYIAHLARLSANASRKQIAEVFKTELKVKNAVFLDVELYMSCGKRRFGRKYFLLLYGRKVRI